MMFAVTIEPLNAIVFLSERPGPTQWSVDEGVSLDIGSNHALRPLGTEEPEQVLAVSKADPKHYRLYKFARDVKSDFEPTGRDFGGVLAKPTWEAFIGGLEPTLAALAITDDE